MSMRERYVEALSLVNVSEAARQTGRALRTMQSRLSGERRVTPQAARELIGYLRAYAHRLLAAAESLEAAISDVEAKDGDDGKGA